MHVDENDDPSSRRHEKDGRLRAGDFNSGSLDAGADLRADVR